MTKTYKWAVVGAGPAGIAAVGKILDEGVSAEEILWLDPNFKVGDFGTLWSNVSSNTKVSLFVKFLLSIKSFSYEGRDFPINSLEQDQTCALKFMATPLQWVSDSLVNKVDSQTDVVTSLRLYKRLWEIKTKHEEYFAKNVILATGAIPKPLNYPDIAEVPLEQAMDKEKLSTVVNENDNVAVFGSSHSAVIIMRYLCEIGVKNIINFYRSPCLYAVEIGDDILFNNTGLKGTTAVWAKDNIDGELSSNMQRYYSNDDNIAHHLPMCDKAIFATGFKRRDNIVLEHYNLDEYNPYTGIIAPGLFGFGIAYPEFKQDLSGSIDAQVGLWKFMSYLHRTMPVWLKYGT